MSVLLLAFFLAGAACAADPGARVTFQKDTPVQFAAFTLTYIGERRVTSEKYPRGFLYYDFRVTTPHGTQTISWSSGTGDIGPTIFKVGSDSFALELKRSDKLGKLNDNELVVSRVP